MTFIDVSAGRPSPGLIAGHSLLCVVSLMCTAWAVNLGRSRQHYQSFFSVRVLFPVTLIILALENAALAASGAIYDRHIDEDGYENFDSNLFIKVVFVLQSFIVPILLIVVFEITYLVHKRRSVNFCCMYFDEGVRVKNTAFMSCMLRNSIRTLAMFLVVLGLVTNFDIIQTGVDRVDRLAGRAGWWVLGYEDLDWDGKIYVLLSLIPTAVLTLVSFYLSIMLWRYGTESAMIVHSSMCNPWFYSFFGTVAMAVGQLFSEELYTVMSNAGMLSFIITLLLVMMEVDKDINASNDVACFLVQLAQKGDQMRITSPTYIQPPGELPVHEEEKLPEDEETGSVALADNQTDCEDNHVSLPPDYGGHSNLREVHKANVGIMQDKRSLGITGITETLDEEVERKKSQTKDTLPSDQSMDTIAEERSWAEFLDLLYGRTQVPSAGLSQIAV